MLTLEQLFKAQAKYGVGQQARGIELYPYSGYLNEVRRNLTDKTPTEFYNWDAKRQDDFTDRCIMEYVKRHQKLIEGFLNDQNDLMMDRLIDKIREDIIDSGILKEALENGDVQEIQINDSKTIFIVIGGIARPYCDSSGVPYQFLDDTELKSTVDRLIYNPDGNPPRMTRTNPIINSRTRKKGYRVSGVDSSAVTPDLKAGFDFPVTTVTIRKSSDVKYVFDDYVKWGSMTARTARFLQLCARADLKIFFVGRTSSGKTTLLGTMVMELLQHCSGERIISIQNPTEMMMYDRSPETLANKYNVLHWEAREVDSKFKDDSTVPTMSNLLAEALRMSPDVIVPGELRLADEFAQVFKALKFDQRILSTFHSSGGNDALNRIASELISQGGGSLLDYLYPLAKSVDLIVSQNKLKDGRRLITGVEEITGNVFQGGIVETNKLVEYTFTGETDYYETGGIKKIHGKFEEVGKISEALRQKFYQAGITKADLEGF